MGGSAQYLMSCLPWPARHGAAKHQRAAFSCQEAWLLLSLDGFLAAFAADAESHGLHTAGNDQPLSTFCCMRASTHPFELLCVQRAARARGLFVWKAAVPACSSDISTRLTRSNNPSVRNNSCFFFSAARRPLATSRRRRC